MSLQVSVTLMSPLNAMRIRSSLSLSSRVVDLGGILVCSNCAMWSVDVEKERYQKVNCMISRIEEFIRLEMDQNKNKNSHRYKEYHET